MECSMFQNDIMDKCAGGKFLKMQTAKVTAVISLSGKTLPNKGTLPF